MKISSKLIIIMLILFILFITNPSTPEYAQWTVNQIKKPENPVTNFFTGTIGKTVLVEATYRNNYYIFSIFEFDGKKTLGILKFYYPLNYSFNND